MNNIESNICDAIEIIVNRAIDQANYDKTIQATIVKCIDQTIGKFLVRYQDSTFYAYSGNPDITYTNGSTVYILIPANDTEADKTILGTSKKLGINYVATIEDDEAYQIIGNNCILPSAYGFGLKSYKAGKQVIVLYSKEYQEDRNLISLNKTSINEYIKNQKTIICGGVIRTDLPAEQQFRGNYGIIFALNFMDNTNNSTVTRYYTIDVDKMRGNPYKILYDTRQYGIFDIDGENFIDVDSISLFCYDFPNNKPDDQCIEDIFIKDIELYGAERLKDDDISNYSLTFYTPRGVYFDSTSLISDTRTIEAQVRIKGKVIDNNSQRLPFYWFIEHAGISSESKYYNKYGGQGWKCLNEYNVIKKATESDPDVVEWVPSSFRWTVTKRDIVAKEVKYKCVVVYDGTIIAKTIVIKNLDSGYDITIESDEGTKFYFDVGFPTLKCLVNGKEDKNLTYSWAVINNVGNFETIADTPSINKDYQEAYNHYYDLLNDIKSEKLPLEPNRVNLTNYRNDLNRYDKITRVDDNTIYHLNVNTITDFSTYQCTVHQGNLYLGTASIVLTNSLTAEGEYTIVIHDGSYVYKYDENGVSPASQAVDFPIEIRSLTFSVYDNLGNIIEDEIIRHSDIQWTVPIRNTMIRIPDSYEKYEEDLEKGIRIYRDFMSFAYEIENRYDITKTNNDIQVVVNYQGMNLSAKTDLVFTKEGDSGTNGTEFFCRIVPNTISGREVPAYPTLTELSDYSWFLNYQPQQSNRFFRVQFWHNENKILDSIVSANSTEGKQATIKWSILQNKYKLNVMDSSALAVNEETGVFTYSGYRNDHPANIIKAEVTYDGVTYYATLPLLTVKIKNDNYRVNLKEGAGFLTAVYSSDGKRPRYDNTNPFELLVTQNINGYNEDISLKTSENYRVSYSWRYLGQIYEKDWIPNINLGDRLSSSISDNQKSVKPLDSYDGQCVTNAIEGVISKSGVEIARIHIPIHLMLNRYGNSAINGWDGNSVNIDTNGGFILAPQVGAGIKEKDNSFTGIVIGKVKESNQSGEDIGLIGYAKGVRSIFLDSKTGKSIFGASGKGQITIDPSSNTAKIYSGNYSVTNKEGMLIDLTTPEIKFGSGNFSVNSSGYITAKGGGSVAGWQINDTRFYKGKVGISSDNTYDSNIAFWAGSTDPKSAPFRVAYDGSMTSTNGYFTGTISGTAISGGTITGTVISAGTIIGNRIEGSNISGSEITSTDSFGNEVLIGGGGITIRNNGSGSYIAMSGGGAVFSGENYGGTILINRNSISVTGGGSISTDSLFCPTINGATPITTGNTSLINSNNITAFTDVGEHGLYVRIGGIAVPTGNWVLDYCTNWYVTQNQFNNLVNRVAALEARPVG